MSEAIVNVASVIPGLGRSAGGPSYSVASLCEAVARTGVQTSIVTVESPPWDSDHSPDLKLVNVIKKRGFYSRRLRLCWAPGFRGWLIEHCRQERVQIIQSHGLWTQVNYAAANAARRLRLPLIVSTHGMLEPWALRHNAWKKRPVWWLWQKRVLKDAVVLRATAEHEVQSIRALGFTNPIALIPNGVDVPRQLKERQPASGLKTALFLSRLHPVKGLLNLVTAWNQARPPGWRLVICGPDEVGHRAQVERAVLEAGVKTSIELRQAVYGQDKDQLLSCSDLFILPTLSENFGMAVAEALAAGLPVITTKGAPWSELESGKCGWWVDIGVEPLIRAIEQATSLSDQKRLLMGNQGRLLIQKKYTWPAIARQMREVYAWILGFSEQPSCVTI